VGFGTPVDFIPGRTEMWDGIDNSVKTSGISMAFKDDTEADTVPMLLGDLFAVRGTLKIGVSESEKYGN
jgi:hypothetical protein